MSSTTNKGLSNGGGGGGANKKCSSSMTRVPMYQIDYSAQNTGKTLPLTKKCVRFQFGYANPQALVEGKVGQECRGEEHVLEFHWSFVTGKRHVYIDDKEIHSSTLARLADPKMPFQLKFHMKSTRDHVCHLLAFATPPAMPGGGDPKQYHLRQFDLRFGQKGVNRRSFFELPKIHELHSGVESIYVLVKNPPTKKSEEALSSSLSSSSAATSTSTPSPTAQAERRASIMVIEEEEQQQHEDPTDINLFGDVFASSTTMTTSPSSATATMEMPLSMTASNTATTPSKPALVSPLRASAPPTYFTHLQAQAAEQQPFISTYHHEQRPPQLLFSSPQEHQEQWQEPLHPPPPVLPTPRSSPVMSQHQQQQNYATNNQKPPATMTLFDPFAPV